MSEESAKSPRPIRVLWACTGSVATVKVPKACAQLRDKGFEVQVVTTEKGRTMLLDGATERYDPVAFNSLKSVRVFTDADEWPVDYTVGKSTVLHIELRRWADVLIIAPLSANTLAKLANGICDNLITCIARAWDTKKPLIVAPAMNTFMWDHPFTSKHLDVLRSFSYFTIVPPVIKTLACNDTGNGAMASIEDIIVAMEEALLTIETSHAATSSS